jgi:hypothetical protein
MRRNIEERLKHKGPLMGEWMRQDERPRPGLLEGGPPPAPMPDQAAIIDDVDIEGARPPGSAAAPPRFSLDPLQDSEQRFRRQARVEQRDGVHISWLAGAADRRRLVKRRNRSDGNIDSLNFA